jgi:putative transposase
VRRFAFIEHNRVRWSVRRTCRILEVTCGGYYAWRKRPVCNREKNQMRLVEKIALVHQQSRGTYGSPRVHAQLVKQGESVNVKTVAKLMKKAEIRVKPKKAFVPKTTQVESAHQTYGNLLDRDFDAEQLNCKWTSDITYIPTEQGWLYLAVILDLCSRRVVGWATGDRLQSELASEALANAIVHRRPGPGLLHHSDRGCQYTSENYQRLLREKQMQTSMSGVGQCWDNAVSESFFGTLKTEWVNQQSYATHQQARSSLFDWIECWYNPTRLHSSLGYQSPEQFEAQFNSRRVN